MFGTFVSNMANGPHFGVAVYYLCTWCCGVEGAVREWTLRMTVVTRPTTWHWRTDRTPSWRSSPRMLANLRWASSPSLDLLALTVKSDHKLSPQTHHRPISDAKKGRTYYGVRGPGSQRNPRAEPWLMGLGGKAPENGVLDKTQLQWLNRCAYSQRCLQFYIHIFKFL